MTTHTQALSGSAYAEAQGAANAIRRWYNRPDWISGGTPAGSNDQTARADALALASALDTTYAAYLAHPIYLGVPAAAVSSLSALSWSTSGANDATTKASLQVFLGNEAVAGRLPAIGPALSALVAQF